MPVSRSLRVSVRLMLGMLLMPAANVGAQSLHPVGAMRRILTLETEATTFALSTDADRSLASFLPPRMLLGLGGSAIGVLAGERLCLALPRLPCGYSDPGLSPALVGAAVGSLVGAGLAAAIPELASNCGYGRRAATGVVVGAIGAVVGSAIGLLSGERGVVLGYILGAGVGAGVGAGHCGG